VTLRPVNIDLRLSHLIIVETGIITSALKPITWPALRMCVTTISPREDQAPG
jgi:hypothetical protein